MSPPPHRGLHAIDATPSITICAQVKNAFTYSLCLGTLLFLPMWVQHLTAADGGITAVGGGKISQEEIFGKTNKKGVTVGGYPKLMFHCLAIVGNTAIWFSVLCNPRVVLRQHEAEAGRGRRLFGLGCRRRRHPYTHPWNDDPASMLDMPMRCCSSASSPSSARASRSRRRFAPPSV